MTLVNMEAAEKLADMGIDAEVVDVRSLALLDSTTIYNSVKKTHRAVVVYEDWKFGGFGGNLQHELAKIASTISTLP
ncbi:MAG: transketolase C-terminal domain-containing protein [Fimbriimonadaceae bacterium]